MQQYRDAVADIAKVGTEITDIAGGLNPLVNLATAVGGKSASNQKVSITDRVMAGASVVPASEVVGTILGVGAKLVSAIKGAREARILRLVDMLHAAETVTDSAEKAKIGEAFSKLATSDELAAEAKRIFELAKDTDTGGSLKIDEAKAAFRLESQLGKQLYRASGGSGEDFRIGSPTGGAIDFWGTMTRDKWEKATTSDLLASLKGKLGRKGLIGVDLKNAPLDKLSAIREFYNSLEEAKRNKIVFIR